MRTNAIIRIILFSLVICILLALLVGGILWGTRGFRRISDTEKSTVPVVDAATAGETNGADSESDSGSGSASDSGATSSSGAASPAASASVAASSVNKLSIEWVSGSITIRPGDTDTITYEETGASDSRYPMVAKQKGGTLTLQYCKDGVSFGLRWPSDLKKDLTVTVPRDWVCRDLEIDAASAAVDIQDLTIGELELDTANGTCRLENCDVGEMDVDTASGDVTFSGTLGSFDCDSASAKITLTLTNVPRSIEVDTASGDLDLTLPKDAGFTASVEGLSTRFSSDFPTTTRNGRYLCGDGACEIQVDAMSGDVTIRTGKE